MRHPAFTLIELLVVIAIIGILSVLVVTQLGNSSIKARNATAQSDIAEMGKAVDSFRTDDGASGAVVSNPPSGTVDTLSGTSGTLPSLFTGTQNIQGLTYAALVQKTPSLAYTYRYYASGTATGTRQLVQSASNQPEYTLCSNLVTALSPAACVQDGSGAQTGSDQVTASSGQGLLSSAGANGLVAWYQLEGSGSQTTAADASGNGNTGTLNSFNFDGTSNGWSAGRYGRSLLFNSSAGDYVAIPLSLTSSALSFSAWVNPSFTSRCLYLAVMSTNLFRIECEPGSPGHFAVASQDGSYNMTCLMTIVANTWYHVALTMDANNKYLYVNGVRCTMSGGNVPPYSVTGLQIGKNGLSYDGLNDPWNGSVDDVRVYSRALSAGEVQQLYQGTL